MPKSSIRSYLTTSIRTRHADIPLIVCCFISGIIDASTYNAYSCFAAMQTGNTIILSLGPSHQPSSRPHTWPKSLMSIASFTISCLIYHRLTTTFGPLRRLTLFTSFLVQTVFILVAASLVQTGSVPERSPNGDLTPGHLEIVPIALLASQFGGQMVTSRLCGIGEVPTTVLTSVYCDFAIDTDKAISARLTHEDEGKRRDLRRKRWRRVGAILGVLLGGITGGWIAKSRAGLAGSLWVGAGLKTCVAFGWLWIKPEQREDEKGKDTKG